jgi:hypothetical protein
LSQHQPGNSKKHLSDGNNCAKAFMCRMHGMRITSIERLQDLFRSNGAVIEMIELRAAGERQPVLNPLGECMARSRRNRSCASPPTCARRAALVRQSVRIHNKERPHQSLKCRTPDEVHRAFFYHHKAFNL